MITAAPVHSDPVLFQVHNDTQVYPTTFLRLVGVRIRKEKQTPSASLRNVLL